MRMVSTTCVKSRSKKVSYWTATSGFQDLRFFSELHLWSI